jgi:DNA-binding MarR family transcriptional regulator
MNLDKQRPSPPLLVSQIGGLANGVRREADKIFRIHGFPFEMDQMQVIFSLYYSGESSQQEICYRLQRDKASVNRTISVFLKKDIVEVTKDAGDKRKTCVKLTEAGTKLAAEAHAVLEKFDVALSSEFTQEERDQFNSLINKLISIVAITK